MEDVSVSRIASIVLLQLVLSSSTSAVLGDEAIVETSMRADLAHAAGVAVEEFSDHLHGGPQRMKVEPTAGGIVSASLLLENYDLVVSVESDRYKVWIHPRTHSGVPIAFGGDATYMIDSRTFIIVDKSLGK